MDFCISFWLMAFLIQLPLAYDEDLYRRPNITNNCPNTKRNHRGINQDIIKDDKYGEVWCCLCNRGQYMNETCNPTDIQSTVCLPCPPNTYMDEDAHSHRHCKEVDRTCREDQDLVYEPTYAPKCLCKYGLFDVSEEVCQKWTKCPEGYGVLHNGTRFSDVICEKCPEAAGLNSSLKLEGCPDNADINQDNGTRSHDDPVPDCPSITIEGFLLGFFTCLFCLIVILCIYLFRNKLHREHKVSSIEKDENSEESNESLMVQIGNK